MAVAEAHDLYRARFDALAARRETTDPIWLAPIRARAMQRFVALGFPTTRHEEWRFTNIAPIAATAFAEPSITAVDRSTIAPFDVRGMSCTRLVFVNGHFSEALSSAGALGAGVRATNLATVLAVNPGLVDPYITRCASDEDQALVALNTAFAHDGAVIHVPARTVVPDPIHVIYLSTTSGAPTVSHPRTTIVVGDQSQVKIIESYGGPDGEVYFTNAVTEVVGGAGSHVEHVRVQRESLSAYHVANTQVRLDRAAVYAQHSFVFGGAIARNDIGAWLGAEGIHCTLNGLYLASGTRLVDTHTAIDHAKPHCESHEVYKGMLDGASRGVFNGKIFVRLDAQKTDAKQTNKVLLLSDDATINTKPQLEIFADDVKCTHGATVGQLDETQLFYLRARGIGEAQARAMLVHAFASEVIDHVSLEPLRDSLESTLLTLLPKAALIG